MKSYQLTTTAQGDLEDIATHLAIQASVDQALRVLGELRNAFRKIGDMPGIGHYREDLLDRHYRFWSVYSYVVVYRWEVTPVQIIAIVHGARDLDAFLSQRPK